jgi:DNA-binding transcriptional MerR regulator
MFGIGEFARAGRVSVRMLRHYDAIGLLRPARIHAGTGYRSYEAAQLADLNRIVALKELGFTLEQVRSIVADKVSIEELRGMLRLRRAEVAEQIAADTARLTHIEARLESIEREGFLLVGDVVIKRIPAVRVAELTGTAADFAPEFIGPVVGPLFGELVERLGDAVRGQPIAYYEDCPEGVLVHAAAPVDFTENTVYLPEIEQAATIVHHGSMDAVIPTLQALAHWIDANGYRSLGYNRELYLECGPEFVTELQEPVIAR